MSIGSKIKEFRKKAGLTQAQLASKANMSRTYVADIERDRYNPSVETLKTIASALEIATSQLLEESEETNQHYIPEWATSKDKRDFKKMLEDDEEIMFDGVPIDEESKEKIKRVMEAIFWDAKKQNKRKPLKDK